MLRIYFFIQNHLKANFLRFFHIKKTDWIPNRFLFAEKEGFEPPEVLPSTVFKTAAIDHSAISPNGNLDRFLICGCKYIVF